jgi:hypothetical protein
MTSQIGGQSKRVDNYVTNLSADPLRQSLGKFAKRSYFSCGRDNVPVFLQTVALIGSRFLSTLQAGDFVYIPIAG